MSLRRPTRNSFTGWSSPSLGYTGQHLSWTQLIFRCQIIFKTETSFKVEKVPLWKTNSGQAKTPGFSLAIDVPWGGRGQREGVTGLGGQSSEMVAFSGSEERNRQEPGTSIPEPPRLLRSQWVFWSQC